MKNGKERTCGTILRQLREKRGWSLQETVNQLDRLYVRENGRDCPLTLSMMSKWERGEHIPVPTYRKLFCLLYQRTATELGFLPVQSPAVSSQTQGPGARTALRGLREERGWSLRELVEQIGRLYQQKTGKACPLTISMLGTWERNEHQPHPTYRKLLCLVFQRTTSELGFLPVPITSDGPPLPPSRVGRPPRPFLP